MNQKLRIDLLIDKSIDFAEICLKEYKEFWPFGYYNNTEDIITLEPTQNENEISDSNILIQHLKSIGDKLDKDYCIAYNVTIELDDTPSDAIAIFLKLTEDSETLNGRIYYFPYDKNYEIIYDKAYLTRA